MNNPRHIPWPARREDLNPQMLHDMARLIAEATGKPLALISESIEHIVEDHYRQRH